MNFGGFNIPHPHHQIYAKFQGEIVFLWSPLAPNWSLPNYVSIEIVWPSLFWKFFWPFLHLRPQPATVFLTFPQFLPDDLGTPNSSYFVMQINSTFSTLTPRLLSDPSVYFLVQQITNRYLFALPNKKDLISFSWTILQSRELKFYVEFFPLWMFRRMIGWMGGWMARQVSFNTINLD